MKNEDGSKKPNELRDEELEQVTGGGNTAVQGETVFPEFYVGDFIESKHLEQPDEGHYAYLVTYVTPDFSRVGADQYHNHGTPGIQTGQSFSLPAEDCVLVETPYWYRGQRKRPQ